MAEATLAHLPDYYGHRETVTRAAPIWSDGTPVPWMTYPAICYLNQLNFSDKQVFEYGCGASTSYWSQRCRHVLSVENDPIWFARASAQKSNNVEIFLQSGVSYVKQISYKAPHDVIVIDGRWRFDCAMNCLPYLAPAGMVILDNSERSPPLTEFFRKAGFIQIDMIGYGPQNRYIWCTSLFLSRDFNFAPARDIQPAHGPGMIDSIEVRPDFASGNRSAL
jgi:hypothetical protein